MDLNASMLPASSMGESEAEVLAGKTPNQAPLVWFIAADRQGM
jgi:hypothetical protein